MSRRTAAPVDPRSPAAASGPASNGGFTPSDPFESPFMVITDLWFENRPGALPGR
jgi:hypothetical protein